MDSGPVAHTIVLTCVRFLTLGGYLHDDDDSFGLCIAHGHLESVREAAATDKGKRQSNVTSGGF